MHLPQHSTAHVRELDTGAESSGEESSVFYLRCKPSTVLHAERPTGTEGIIWLTIWFHGYFDRQLHSNITWDPLQNHYPVLAPTGYRYWTIYFPTLLQRAISELTQMDVNQDVHMARDRHKSGSVVAPEVHFCTCMLLSSCHSSARAHPVWPVCKRSSRLVPAPTFSFCPIPLL